MKRTSTKSIIMSILSNLALCSAISFPLTSPRRERADYPRSHRGVLGQTHAFIGLPLDRGSASRRTDPAWMGEGALGEQYGRKTVAHIIQT